MVALAHAVLRVQPRGAMGGDSQKSFPSMALVFGLLSLRAIGFSEARAASPPTTLLKPRASSAPERPKPSRSGIAESVIHDLVTTKIEGGRPAIEVVGETAAVKAELAAVL